MAPRRFGEASFLLENFTQHLVFGQPEREMKLDQPTRFKWIGYLGLVPSAKVETWHRTKGNLVGFLLENL